MPFFYSFFPVPLSLSYLLNIIHNPLIFAIRASELMKGTYQVTSRRYINKLMRNRLVMAFHQCIGIPQSFFNLNSLEFPEHLQGNLLLSMKRPEVAVIAFRGAQELRADLRSYQGAVSSFVCVKNLFMFA